ncbi:MAG: esterase family protein [Saprospiraceae bacterium]|nr:esterase family protein [Saprospiraceae bacterium]
MKNLILFLALILIVAQGRAQGTVERIKFKSQALEGNLIGDDPTRDVSIYLPEGYKDSDTRYPVLFMLHGFTDDDSKWFGHEEHWINLPELLDQAFEDDQLSKMIVVMPNAYNRFKGSMYSSSATIGDWETFIANELVAFIDDNYRTIANPSARGLAGHSMGGYGTIRLAMKRPGVFSAIYLLSPCCMESNVNPNPGLRRNVEAVQRIDQLEEQPFFVSATLALSAAWAPNPQNPPFYFDLPFAQEIDRPEIVAKFQANSILSMIDQYISHLRDLNAIAHDVGDQDWGISGPSKKLDEILSAYQIDHYFEIYQGDHVNRIGERIVNHVLPFFSSHFPGN